MSAPGMGSSILLVSDSPLVFADLADILKTDPDLDVRLVPDTDTAAESIAAEKPHLIICRCSAFEALSQVCEEKEGDDTGALPPFFLLLFQGTDAREVAAALGRGAHDYIEESLCRQNPPSQASFAPPQKKAAGGIVERGEKARRGERASG